MARWSTQRGRFSRHADPVVRPKSNLEEIEVLVREVVQNSLDAALDPDEAVRMVSATGS